MTALTTFIVCLAMSLPAAAQIPGANRFYLLSPGDQFALIGSGVRVNEVGMGAFPPPPDPGRPAEMKISADELRYPLTDKARAILAKAWKTSSKGDHLGAIAILKQGVAKVRALVPYSHGFLGIEYLETGRIKEAVAEMKQSTELFPHDAPGRSNFAVSLCLTGDLDGAEREAKLALYLEPTLNSAAEIVRIVEERKAAHTAPAEAIRD